MDIRAVKEATRMPEHTHGEDPFLDYLLAAAAAADAAELNIPEKIFHQLVAMDSLRIISNHCPKCEKLKGVDEFTAKAKHGQCKSCHAAYQRTREVASNAPRTEGDKHCKRCDVTKPVTGFGRNKRNKDGLHAYCKPCAYAQVRASTTRNK